MLLNPRQSQHQTRFNMHFEKLVPSGRNHDLAINSALKISLLTGQKCLISNIKSDIKKMFAN